MLKVLTKTMKRLRKELNLLLQTTKEIPECILEQTVMSHKNPKINTCQGNYERPSEVIFL